MALLPAAWLALLTFWGGTFAGGATFSGAVSAQASLLILALLGAARWRDPLGLGGTARWLVPALLVVVGASWLTGSVPRAGIVGLCLLPAFLLSPAAVAACWKRPRERWLGVAAVGIVFGLVAVWALVRWQVQGSPRAAMPLGHHNLLGAWLVILWPLALAPVAARRAWRLPAAALGLVAVVALAATGSFLAACALFGQALLAAFWWRRARIWLAVALVIVWTGPGAVRWGTAWLEGRGAVPELATPAGGVPGNLARSARMASGSDSSLRARLGYARAGLKGFSQRPVLGNGPGSVPWTIGRFHRPVTGLNPASEVVGDLHSWPLQLAYETGAAGVVLVVALGWLFVRRRRDDLATGCDAVPLEAALVGLCGGAILLLGNAPIAVAALPAALAVVAGLALSCGSQPPPKAGWPSVGLASLYLVVAVAVLFPLDRAHLAYRRALGAETGRVALDHLERARELDPEFPLYRARAAWLETELSGSRADLAGEARRAAVTASDVAALWLAAGALGLESGQPWAEDAVTRARTLDPLSPLNAFFLLRARPTRPDAVELGAEAVAGDPRLGAAVFWERHPALYSRVLERLGQPPVGTRSEGPTALLVQSLDYRPALSFSLFAFRRSPWPADIAPVEVRVERLPAGFSP